MALPATDNFNRANEDPLAGNWTQNGNALRIVSNEVTTPASYGFCHWNADTFANDQYCQCRIKSASMVYAGPCVRCAVSDTVGYGAWVSGSFLYFFYLSAGFGYNQIGSAVAITPAVNDVIKLTCVGTTLEAFQNGASLGTRTHSTHTSGWAGIHNHNTAAAIDDFEAGDVTSGTVHDGAATLAAAVSTLISAIVAWSAVTILAAAATVSVAATVNHSGAATLPVTASVSASASAAAQDAAATLTAEAMVERYTLIGGLVIQVSPHADIIHGGAAVLTATAQVGAYAGALTLVGEATLAASALVSSSAEVSHAGVSTLPASVSVNAAAIMAQAAAATLAAAAGVSVAAIQQMMAQATIAATVAVSSSAYTEEPVVSADTIRVSYSGSRIEIAVGV
jgi:hypothetical protein